MTIRNRKIVQTNPSSVRGKLVKYHKGDCLSIKTGNGYLAAIVTEKFNKYYDLTLIQYHEKVEPVLSHFINGRFFGTRFGSWEEVQYASDRRMIECIIIDNLQEIKSVGHINLISSVLKASYGYETSITALEMYYGQELPVRIEKTLNAEKFPDLAFVSKHLIEVKNVIAL